MIKIIKLIFLTFIALIGISCCWALSQVWAANPIATVTPYTGNSGFVLSGSGTISNSCINQAGSNYYITYSYAPSGTGWTDNLQVCFASIDTNSFPGTITPTGTCLPQTSTAGSMCSAYYTGIAEPYIFFDPVLSVYHGFMGDALTSTSYQNVAHLTASGTSSSFPTTTSSWTYESCQIASIGPAGQNYWVTM